MEHACLNNVLSFPDCPDTGPAALVEMIVSCRRLQIGASFIKRFIGGQVRMLHLESGRVAEVDDRTVNDILHFDDPAVIQRCHIQLNRHPVYMLPAYETHALNLRLPPFPVAQADTFYKSRPSHVKRARKGEDLAILYPDQLFLHVKPERKPVRHVRQLPHECL